MSRLLFGLALLSLGVAPLSTWGAAIDTLTLTQNGADTLFTVAGTFPSDFPTTPYSVPNSPYVLTFTVPTAPTSIAFVDPIGVFVLDASVTLNGVTYSNSQVAFFTPDLGGGVDVCTNDICSPNPPTIAPRFAVFTNPVQLFTGSLSSPVFISGPVSVDTSQSFIESPVPEPTPLTLVLLGGGFLILALLRKRKRQSVSLSSKRETPIQ